VWSVIAHAQTPDTQRTSAAAESPAATLAVSVLSRAQPAAPFVPAVLHEAVLPRAPIAPPRRRLQAEERRDLFAVAADISSAPAPRARTDLAPMQFAAPGDAPPLAPTAPAAVAPSDPALPPRAAIAPVAAAAVAVVEASAGTLEVPVGQEIGAGGHAGGISASGGDLAGGAPAISGGGGPGPGARRRRRPIELFGRVVGGRGCAVPAHAAIPCASLRESTALRARDHFPRLPAALWPDPRPYIVKVEICVSVAGAVSDAVLLSKESERFDPIVLEAVRAWVYRPRLSAGAPTPFCHSVVIQYDSP
jgi:hypothetical protein